MLPIIKINYSHHNLASLHSSKLSLFSFQGAIDVFDEILLFVRSDCILIHREAKSEISQKLVGSSGLEPPTSRLSGVRSNHLSYEPMLVYVGLLVLCPTCGGDEQNRTVDPLLAKQVLSQLSYTPTFVWVKLIFCSSLKTCRAFKIKQRFRESVG